MANATSWPLPKHSIPVVDLLQLSRKLAGLYAVALHSWVFFVLGVFWENSMAVRMCSY